MVAPLVGLRSDLGLGISEVGSRLELAMMIARSHPAARAALLGQGWTREQLESMPLTQAFMVHEVLVYDSIFDDFVKWASLPYPQLNKGLTRAEQRFLAPGTNRSLGGSLAILLLPAVNKVMFATIRVDRRRDALRCVEALRLYGVSHEGRLPQKLADITEVPVPVDPLTGKPFEYQLADGKATLTAPTPPRERPNSGNTIIYEITLKK